MARPKRRAPRTTDLSNSELERQIDATIELYGFGYAGPSAVADDMS